VLVNPSDPVYERRRFEGASQWAATGRGSNIRQRSLSRRRGDSARPLLAV